MSKQNETQEPQPKQDEIYLADLPLAEENMEGVVGGLASRPQRPETSPVLRTCW